MIDFKKIYREAESRRRQRLLGYLRRKRPVFAIEGTWSGYTSSQRRVCHLCYTTDVVFADAVKDLGSIRFSDNTYLYLSVKQVTDKSELRPENDEYDSLIRKCVDQGVSSVAGLKEER